MNKPVTNTTAPDTEALLDETDSRNGTALAYKLNAFEGPLDLLLELIKKNEVNIYDIPIAEITEQYLYHLSFATEYDLDNLSDFHLMAAHLLLIKSRMLLPVEFADDEPEDPREELVEKLIEYQRLKKLTSLIEERGREAEWVIERRKMQRTLPFDMEERIWTKMDVWNLLKTFTALTHITPEKIMDLREEVSINEKITLLNELLETRRECLFTDLLTRPGSLLDIVCAFFALLEAVKFKAAVIFQNKLFGDIMIRPGENAGNKNDGVEFD